MKTVFVSREKREEETRVALIPQDVSILTRLGFEIVVEKGLGKKSGFADEAYVKAGATLADDPAKALAEADIVVRVLKPENAKGMKPGALHLSFLDPFNEKELLNEVAAADLNAASLEMIPRRWTCRARRLRSRATTP